MTAPDWLKVRQADSTEAELSDGMAAARFFEAFSGVPDTANIAAHLVRVFGVPQHRRELQTPGVMVLSEP